jgi:nicotinamidase-related amidase
MATVLLVMDIQKKMMEFIPTQSQQLLDNLSTAIAAARKAKIPVVYVLVGFKEGFPEISQHNMGFSAVKQNNLFLLSDEGTGIHEQVAPQGNEPVIVKKRISAYAGSDLEVILRGYEATDLVITGFATSGVVLNTVRESADKDYKLTVLADGCADSDTAVHEFLVNNIFSKQAAITTCDDWAASL